MSSFYEIDRDDEPDTTPREAQADDFCECRPGVEMRQRSQHLAECLRYVPPLTGPGHNHQHRAKVLAYCKGVIADTKKQHQEKPKEEEA